MLSPLPPLRLCLQLSGHNPHCPSAQPSPACSLQEAKLKAKKAQAWQERLKTQAEQQQAKQQKWVWGRQRGRLQPQSGSRLKASNGAAAAEVMVTVCCWSCTGLGSSSKCTRPLPTLPASHRRRRDNIDSRIKAKQDKKKQKVGMLPVWLERCCGQLQGARPHSLAAA